MRALDTDKVNNPQTWFQHALVSQHWFSDRDERVDYIATTVAIFFLDSTRLEDAFS